MNLGMVKISTWEENPGSFFSFFCFAGFTKYDPCRCYDDLARKKQTKNSKEADDAYGRDWKQCLLV